MHIHTHAHSQKHTLVLLAKSHDLQAVDEFCFSLFFCQLPINPTDRVQLVGDRRRVPSVFVVIVKVKGELPTAALLPVPHFPMTQWEVAVCVCMRA